MLVNHSTDRNPIYDCGPIRDGIFVSLEVKNKNKNWQGTQQRESPEPTLSVMPIIA
jgi:hypothetical protein